ncbi:MAG: hypothetical protein ACREPA_00680, partial [Candidatus Dormibacteraceae bacterium]
EPGGVGRGRATPDPARRRRLLEGAVAGPGQALLFEAELGLVAEVAGEREEGELGAEDLFQAGALGLLAAIRELGVESADPDSFETVARGRIRSAMDAAAAEEAASRADQMRIIEAMTDYERVELALARRLRRPATAAEMGEKLEWSAARVEAVGEKVGQTRDAHDEELVQYLDPESEGSIGRIGDDGVSG